MFFALNCNFTEKSAFSMFSTFTSDSNNREASENQHNVFSKLKEK